MAIDGKQVIEPEIVYFCQMKVVYVIIVTYIANLSLLNGKSELYYHLTEKRHRLRLTHPLTEHLEDIRKRTDGKM